MVTSARIHSEEALVVRIRFILTSVLAMVVLGLVAPLHAQETAPSVGSELIKWSIITGGFALAIAASFGAIAQGLSISAAAAAIARNPSAAGEIRGSLILGLVLIESLVIYTLLISLILFFIQPFGG